jgi:BlaI family penicillinase repressor
VKKSAPISDAESIVMRVFWTRGSQTAEQVFTALEDGVKWQESTIKTLLNRLLTKGALSARKDNRRYVYHPVLTRDEWLAHESHGFLDRLFDGRIAPFVSYFSRHKKLTKKDLEELKRLVKELENGS